MALVTSHILCILTYPINLWSLQRHILLKDWDSRKLIKALLKDNNYLIHPPSYNAGPTIMWDLRIVRGRIHIFNGWDNFSLNENLNHAFNCENLSTNNGNSLSNISPDYTSTSLISENLHPLSLKLKPTWKDQLRCITLTLQVVPQTRKFTTWSNCSRNNNC